MKTTYNNFKQILKKTQTIKTGINRKSYQEEYGKNPGKIRKRGNNFESENIF